MAEPGRQERMREPDPIKWGTDRTIIAEGGQEDGISVGEAYTVVHDEREYDVEVVSVGQTRSILQVDDLDIQEPEPRSLKDSILEIFQ